METLRERGQEASAGDKRKMVKTGASSFTDVMEGQWYSNAVATAQAMKTCREQSRGGNWGACGYGKTCCFLRWG